MELMYEKLTELSRAMGISTMAQLNNKFLMRLWLIVQVFEDLTSVRFPLPDTTPFINFLQIHHGASDTRRLLDESSIYSLSNRW